MMTDLLIAIMVVTGVIIFSLVIYSSCGGRSTASLQIEQCKLNAEATVKARHVRRMEEVVMKHSAAVALGVKLKPHEYEELRIASNELFYGGQP